MPGFLSGSTMYSHGELGTYLNINCPENTQEYNSIYNNIYIYNNIWSTRSEANSVIWSTRCEANSVIWSTRSEAKYVL